jgi:hypothetical protein
LGIALAIVAAAVLALPQIKSVFVSNLGWVYVARAATSAMNGEEAVQAERWFAQVPPAGNVRYLFGYGIASLQMGDTQAALARWQQGKVSYNTLAELGSSHQLMYHWKAALGFYVGADQQAQQAGVPATYTNQFCQMIRTRESEYLGDKAHYCQSYLDSGNLLVNGDFQLGADLGWRLYPKSVVPGLVMNVEASTSDQGSVLKLVTSSPDTERFLLCQRIPLYPNESVRFSVDVKVDAQANTGSAAAMVRPLYIGWQKEGSPEGNTRQLTTPLRWTSYARDFQLPEGAAPGVLFCPLVITGAATAWVANAQVDSLSGLP